MGFILKIVRLHDREIDVWKTLCKEKRSLTVNEIANISKIPLPSIYDNVRELVTKNLVIKDREEGGEVYWKAVSREEARKILGIYVDEVLDEIFGKDNGSH